MFCSNCGNALVGDARFCSGCGVAVNVGSAGYKHSPVIHEQPGRDKAIIALVLGIVALLLPIPIIDVGAGIAGIVLANRAREMSPSSLASGAWIVSIIGTIWAGLFTLLVLMGLRFW